MLMGCNDLPGDGPEPAGSGLPVPQSAITELVNEWETNYSHRRRTALSVDHPRLVTLLNMLHLEATEPVRVDQQTLERAQALADEMDAENGPVTEDELKELRKVWPHE